MAAGPSGLGHITVVQGQRLRVRQQSQLGTSALRGRRLPAQIQRHHDGQRAGAGRLSRDGHPAQLTLRLHDGFGAAMPGKRGGPAVRSLPGLAGGPRSGPALDAPFLA